MKRKTVKIIAFLSLIVLVMNIFNPISFAEDTDLPSEQAKQEETAWEETESRGLGSVILDGIAGILLYPMKLMIIGLAQAVRLITGTVAQLGGGHVDVLDFSLDSILFNEVPLVKLDFFNIAGETNLTLSVLKKNIAQWYYIIRNISLVILLGILIYVGIRMAISTVAEEEAKYKKMLENWIVSIVLLFLLHYIIILILTVNNSLVDVFRLLKPEGAGFTNTLEWILSNCWGIMFTKSIGNTIVYTILVGVTLIFLLSYIKRMVTVAFLIMISPLIVVTYSIDKMGDGKSQALNTWLKEFSYNVLIQPFHCVIYLSLVSTAVKLMSDAPSLGSAVLAIVLVVFIWTAEDIVKNIFGFEAKSMAQTIKSAAVISTALGALGKKKKEGAQGAGGSAGGSGNSTSNDSGADEAGAGLGKMPKMKNMLKKKGGADNTEGAGGTGGARHSGSSGGNVDVSGDSSDRIKPSKVAQTGARIGQGIQNMDGKYASTSFKLAMAGFGAALGASTGSLETTIIGTKAGGKVGKKYGGKVANLASHPITTTRQAYRGKRNPRILKSNQRQFASAVNNYRKQMPNIDDEKFKKISKNLLNMSDQDAAGLNPENAKLRDNLKNMNESYKAMGMNNKESSQAVLDTIDAVQNGSIRSSRRADKEFEKERMQSGKETEDKKET